MVRFSYGKFVEALDEGKGSMQWPRCSQGMNLVRCIFLL